MPDVGLFLNAPKTKYMHLNPSTNTTVISSDGSPIELVQDFKYLGGYTDSGYDMKRLLFIIIRRNKIVVVLKLLPPRAFPADGKSAGL